MADPTPVIENPQTKEAEGAAEVAEQQIGANSTVNAEKAASSFNNIDDLMKRNPKLYNMMLLGISIDICGKMRRSQERIKKMMREGEPKPF